MRKYFSLFAVTIGAGLMLYLSFGRGDRGRILNDSVKPVPTDSRILDRGEAVTTLSRKELRERLVPHFKKEGYQYAEMEVLVDEGRTVLTDGYEEEAGQLIFSAITPRFSMREDGVEMVKFDLKRYRCGLDGNYTLVQEGESQVHPQAKTGIGSKTGGVSYQMTVRAHRDEATNKIRLHTIENQHPG